jgi:hypothetical protein
LKLALLHFGKLEIGLHRFQEDVTIKLFTAFIIVALYDASALVTVSCFYRSPKFASKPRALPSGAPDEVTPKKL